MWTKSKVCLIYFKNFKALLKELCISQLFTEDVPNVTLDAASRSALGVQSYQWLACTCLLELHALLMQLPASGLQWSPACSGTPCPWGTPIERNPGGSSLVNMRTTLDHIFGLSTGHQTSVGATPRTRLRCGVWPHPAGTTGGPWQTSFVDQALPKTCVALQNIAHC